MRIHRMLSALSALSSGQEAEDGGLFVEVREEGGGCGS